MVFLFMLVATHAVAITTVLSAHQVACGTPLMIIRFDKLVKR
ncbi:hypothetical protein NMG60_11013091 [Bertholletia excelsa]